MGGLERKEIVVATNASDVLIETIADKFRTRRVHLHVDPYVDPDFAYSADQRTRLDRVLQRDRSSHVDRQLNYGDYATKVCSAGRNYINLMPNGDVYTCANGFQYVHSPLSKTIVDAAPRDPLVDAYRMGNLFDADFRLRSGDMECHLPCTSPCDFDAVRIRN
jgi:hypothetical protein